MAANTLNVSLRLTIIVAISFTFAAFPPSRLSRSIHPLMKTPTAVISYRMQVSGQTDREIDISCTRAILTDVQTERDEN